MRTFTSLIVAAALVLTGCAGAYKTTYIAGATAKTFITEAHGEYDNRVQTQLAICEPETNVAITTKGEFDTCMGTVYGIATQEKIVQALAVYTATATAFSAVMLGCQPNADGTAVSAATCIKKTFTDAELRSWRGKIIAAATEALRYFPDAEAKIASLTGLIGK